MPYEFADCTNLAQIQGKWQAVILDFFEKWALVKRVSLSFPPSHRKLNGKGFQGSLAGVAFGHSRTPVEDNNS